MVRGRYLKGIEVLFLAGFVMGGAEIEQLRLTVSKDVMNVVFLSPESAFYYYLFI